MFKPVSNKVAFPKMEEEVLSYWGKDGTFEKSLRKNEGKERYTFYDGPPFATGLPHYGHLLAGIIKDIRPFEWEGFAITADDVIVSRSPAAAPKPCRSTGIRRRSRSGVRKGTSVPLPEAIPAEPGETARKTMEKKTDNVVIRCVVACLFALFSVCGATAGIVIENAAFRLSLSRNGFAESLVVKATGEECLMPGVRIPFARLRQDRPYDNELHLIHPAKPMLFPSDRISMKGDVLEIGFARECHVMKVRVTATDDYVSFVPEGTDYRITENLGLKRRTEIDGIEFLRLPVRARRRFGECANVMWDDRTAVAVMGLLPEVRISGEIPEGTEGWRLFSAGTEDLTGLFGRGAAIVAGAAGKWLDHVDAMERDHDMPRGVKNRRDPLMRASYCLIERPKSLSSADVDEYIMWMKKGGFRVCMIYYWVFSDSCGHFVWNDMFPNGIADLKVITDRLRAAGIVPAFHFHYNKVTTSDPYVTDGMDPRIACVKEVCLAEDAGPDDETLFLQGATDGLRTEEGRRLVMFGDELVSYEAFTVTPPWKLTGVRRGLYKTPRRSHARGSYGRHLDVDDWHRFIRIDQSTSIQDEIAGRIAELVDTCGFRILYFDGGEDVPPPYWYHVPLAQKRVWDRIRCKPRGAESALKSHYGWHMLSRGNAFDTFRPEQTARSLEKYLLPAARLAEDDFTTVNFGWLRLFMPGEKFPRSAGAAPAESTAGSTPEQIDMVARAAYERGAPLSLKISLSRLREHPHAEAIMAVFKKYEDLKFKDIDLMDREDPR